MNDVKVDRVPAGARVCAVVVTYHPDQSLPERVHRVLPQVAAAVIVDNGSTGEGLRAVRAIPQGPTLELILNGENLGIARALNIGIRHARAAGFSFALLLDQDTLVDPDMVERLAATYASCGDPGHVAAVGSRFRDPNGPAGDSIRLAAHESIRLAAQGADWQEVESVITSGTLLILDVHERVGPFRDDFFIDYVDTEYCLRARAAGFRIVETQRPLMSHTVGAPTAHRLFGATTWTSNHSPNRRYYIARNNTVLLREYGTSGRGPWQWKSFVRCLRLCKRIAYFERDKLDKIGAVAQGWWDAMRGRMGPRPHR